MDEDSIKRIIHMIDPLSRLSCRLVNKEWMRCVDETACTVVRNVLMARKYPIVGRDIRDITVISASPLGCNITYRKSNGEEHEYWDDTTDHPALANRFPVAFKGYPMLTACDRRSLMQMRFTLQDLDLTGIKYDTIPSWYRRSITNAIASMKDLRVLRVPSLDISASDAEMISRCTTLEVLDIENNDIEDHGIRCLSNLINLTELNASNNNMSSGVATLSALTNLVSLRMSFNGADDADMYACWNNLRKLETLQSSWNDVGGISTRALPGLTNLVSLDLSFTCGAACEMIKNLPVLEELYYSSSMLNDESMRHVSNLNLKKLVVPCNEITDAGAEHLSKGKTTSSLMVLDLSVNYIGYIGAVFIGGIKNLTDLNVRRNMILDAGAMFLLSMDSLRRLDVANNNLSVTTERSLRSFFSTYCTVFPEE